MNKLNPEDLHLLLDEPIYVLHEHFDSGVHEPENEAIEPSQVLVKGENKKGIIILNEDNTTDLIAPDDEIFLFKGLNALGITLADIVILDATQPLAKSMQINKQIKFSASSKTEQLYDVKIVNGIQELECHPLKEIISNKELKVKFWLSLKSLFA